MSGIAVLMIDMQNMYKSTDGTRERLGWPPIWRQGEVISECDALMSHARATGIPVIYSRASGRDDRADVPPGIAQMMKSRGLDQPGHDPVHADWKREIMDELTPEPGDIVMDKLRPSFFEFTALEAVLMNLGVTRLVLAGLQTNVCVESTARSALAHNYDVAIAEDAVSTDGPALHWGALNALRVLYAEVAPWRELLADGAVWERRSTTPNYGRDPEYWDERVSGSSPIA